VIQYPKIISNQASAAVELSSWIGGKGGWSGGLGSWSGSECL